MLASGLMKGFALTLVLAGTCLGQNGLEIPANPVAPATPGGFERRNTGSGSGVGVRAKEVPRETRKIQYIAVTGPRVWNSADGRVVRAAMLAYEPGPVPENVSKPLTLVKDGKIRLLLETRKMVTELPLEKLSKDDQSFVEKLVAAQKRAGEKEAEKAEE